MITTNQNFYILKQTDSTTWNFSYIKGKGIVYRTSVDDKWSDYTTLAENAYETFSALLLPNDFICILCENFQRNMILFTFNKIEWKEKTILQRKVGDNSKIYFDAVFNKNEVHIFYSIDKTNNEKILVHQSYDNNLKLKSPKVIDNIYDNFNNPFKLYVSNNNDIFLTYQTYKDKYCLGYRSLSNDTDAWSDFNIIEKSPNPYPDYSLLASDNNLHMLYIEESANTSKITYFSFSEGKHKELFQNKKIKSCSLFILDNSLYTCWICGDDIYISFSINNGKIFSSPPYKEALNGENIIKATYISNHLKDKQHLTVKELFVEDNDNLNYLILSNVLPKVYGYKIKNKPSKKSNEYLLYVKNYMNKAYEKINIYETELKQKEQLVVQLNHMLREEKIKCESYENKFKNISTLQQNLISKENKLKVLENINLENKNEINLLQSTTAKKEDKISFLEKINEEKEKQIIALKKQLDEHQNKISSLVEEVSTIKSTINTLNSEIKSNKSKTNESIFKRMFGNKT